MRPVAWTLLLLGCHPPGDAERYAHALSEAEDFEDAAASCEGIRDPSARGDCTVAVMERFGAEDAAVCHALQREVPEMAVWRDECMFQLAERLRARGAFEPAMAACLDSRFARECFWHLVHDEATASLAEAPEVAEGRIARFATAGPIPDAALQFWASRFRAEAAADRPPDEATCTPLRDPAPCHEGLRRFVRAWLEVRHRLDPATTCAATAPGADPAALPRTWRPGPVVAATEARWHGRVCAVAPALPPAP